MGNYYTVCRISGGVSQGMESDPQEKMKNFLRVINLKILEQ
jgi:hypothetical protein